MASGAKVIDAKEAIIAWTPGTDQIQVGPLLKFGDLDWTSPYECTGGAVYLWVRSADDDTLGASLKADFIAIVFRDAVDPRAAYREFSKIKQFQDAIPEDMPKEARLFCGQ